MYPKRHNLMFNHEIVLVPFAWIRRRALSLTPDLRRQISGDRSSRGRAKHPEAEVVLHLMEHGFAVTEFTESVMAVIGAHARGSDSAERQFFLDDMHHHVVDRHAA